MSARLASAAFRYAMRKIAVFPLTPGTKVPLAGSNGCNGGTNDPDATRARWQKTPNANIAAATGARSGFWVLDVDQPNSLAALVRQFADLPETAETSTPHDGRHLYWRHVEGIRNSAGRIGPGLDVRGEGGSIVLPPSVLADGGRYCWTNTVPVAEAPEWLVKLALPPPPPPKPDSKPLSGDISAYVGTAVAAELRELGRAGEGTRNESLNRAAFNVAQFCHAGALPEDWARQQLERVALAIGLPAFEARGTIDSAFKAAPARELPR